MVLVTDGPKRTTKYLLCLALGVPAVHWRWLRDALVTGQAPEIGYGFKCRVGWPCLAATVTLRDCFQPRPSILLPLNTAPPFVD